MFAVNPQINNMKYQYDRDHDVLHLSFGMPTISNGDEPHPGIFIKYADVDDIVTGAVILEFQKCDTNLVNKFLPINVDLDEMKKYLFRNQ